MRIILLFLIVFSFSHAEFTRSDDMVMDSTTGLVWQDDVISDELTWENAIVYCEDMTLGGFEDWRLPNINELGSIVDETAYRLALDDVFLADRDLLNEYWSSTTDPKYSNEAFYLDFREGRRIITGKAIKQRVRCVRSGQ